jgi:hypothetical protein
VNSQITIKSSLEATKVIIRKLLKSSSESCQSHHQKAAKVIIRKLPNLLSESIIMSINNQDKFGDEARPKNPLTAAEFSTLQEKVQIISNWTSFDSQVHNLQERIDLLQEW